MEGMLEAVLTFILIYGPAMVANGSPVFVLRGRRGHPIDFGKTWVDGRRVLGDGKTFEGFLIGVAAALLTGIVVGIPVARGVLGLEASTALWTSFFSGLGAMLGDVVKSFFKRRLGRERGSKLLVADQLDFYVGATLLVYLCNICPNPSLPMFATGALFIFVLHIATNKFAKKMGWKKVPW